MRIGVDRPADVSHLGHHLLGRRVPAHSGKCRIHAQIAAVDGGLKYSLHRVFEETAKLLFCLTPGLLRTAAFADILVHREAAKSLSAYRQGHPDNVDVQQKTVPTAALRRGTSHFSGRAGCEFSGLRRSIGRSQHGIELYTRNFGHLIAEKTFKGGIAHLDGTVHVENDDAERIVFRKRLQVGGVGRDAARARRVRTSGIICLGCVFCVPGRATCGLALGTKRRSSTRHFSDFCPRV